MQPFKSKLAKYLVLSLGLSFVGMMPRSAQAQNDAYSPDASGNFSTGFTLGTTTPTPGGTSSPANGDSLYFGTQTTGSTTPTNDLVGFTFAGFTFNAGASAFTIGGNAFTLTTGITNNSTNTEIINNAITTSGAIALNLSSASASLTLGGNLTGSGAITQTGFASGVTTLTLGGDNSGFTGSFSQVNSSSNRTAFNTATAGSAAAAWTFNRAVGGGIVFNFAAGTINFGSLSGAGFIRNNIAGTDIMSVGALGTSTTFSGAIQDNGNDNIALTKVGAGDLTFSGTGNNYDGDTIISGGRIVLANGATLSAGILQYNSAGGALGFTGTTATIGTINGAQNLALTNDSAGAVTLTLAGATAATYSGVLSGGGGLIKTGTGAQTFSGANTYSGATQLITGTTILTGNGGAANSAITLGAVNGGATTNDLLTITDTLAGSVTRGASLTTNGNNGTGNNFNNASITGTAAGNSNDVFSGPLTLNSGAFRLAVTPNAATNTALTFGSYARNVGTVFNVNANPGANPIASATANSTNIIFTTAPTLVGGGGAIGTSTTSILPSAIINSQLGTYDSTNGLRPLTTFGSVVDGTATQVNASNTTNAAVITVNSATAVNSLTLGGSPTAVVVNGTGTLTITSGAINLTQSNVFNVANLDFGSAEGLIYVQNIRTPTINSVITGSGGMTVNFNDSNNSTGRLILAGANTYTGVTTLTGNNSGMAVNLTNSLAFQNTTLDYNNYGASLIFGNGTTTGQTAYTFGGLTGGQNINLNNNNTTVGAVALTIGSAGSVDTASTINTYSGVLSNTVAGGSVVKAGVAIEVFSGANTYSGGTTINGGTLRVNNTTGSGTGTGAVTVGNGTTLFGTLGGSGIINVAGNTVTVNSGSNLSPGNSAGTLTIVGTQTVAAAGTSTLNLASGSNFVLELNGSTPGTQYDRVILTGTLSISNSNLSIALANNFDPTGTTFNVIAVGGTSTAALIGTFAGPVTASNNLGTYTFTPAYNGGDGNDVILTAVIAVPEPGTYAIIGLGLVLLLGMNRFRRQA